MDGVSIWYLWRKGLFRLLSLQGLLQWVNLHERYGNYFTPSALPDTNRDQTCNLKITRPHHWPPSYHSPIYTHEAKRAKINDTRQDGCLTSNSAGSQQVHNVYMISQVAENFQLWHQRLFFCGMSTCCWRKRKHFKTLDKDMEQSWHMLECVWFFAVKRILYVLAAGWLQ